MSQKKIYVIKADGRKQLFDRNKIMRTCLRMGATQDMAEAIVSRIEKQSYNNIPTKKIIRMVLSYMRKYNSKYKYVINLRDAICMLRPKPDFEMFIAQLMKSHGFKVKSNRMIRGRCVEHEIDAIAERATRDKHGHDVEEVLYVEVKHHYKPHTYTGMDVFLEAQATFEDLVDGYKSGENNIPFTGTMVVSNTKLSDHALRYSKCRGIVGLAWKTPPDRGLERMIEEKKLYPITFIRGLTPDQQSRLGDNRIVTMRQLLEKSDSELHRMTRIPKKNIIELKEKAREVMNK